VAEPTDGPAGPWTRVARHSDRTATPRSDSASGGTDASSLATVRWHWVGKGRRSKPWRPRASATDLRTAADQRRATGSPSRADERPATTPNDGCAADGPGVPICHIVKAVTPSSRRRLQRQRQQRDSRAVSKCVSSPCLPCDASRAQMQPGQAGGVSLSESRSSPTRSQQGRHRPSQVVWSVRTSAPVAAAPSGWRLRPWRRVDVAWAVVHHGPAEPRSIICRAACARSTDSTRPAARRGFFDGRPAAR
jgi:hypothetical protein